MEVECLAFFLYYLQMLEGHGILIDDTFIFNLKAWLTLYPNEMFFALTSELVDAEEYPQYFFNMEKLLEATPIANKLLKPEFYVKLLDHLGVDMVNEVYNCALEFYSYTYGWGDNYEFFGQLKQ